MQEKILLVDDDQSLLDACRRNLRRRFALETALGPERGLEVLQQHGPFAVVISDMRMPVMDGVQFLARVRELCPQTICMMLTGHPDLQTAVDAVNEGAVFRFLYKPCPYETLSQAIDAALEQRRLVHGQVELLQTKLRHAQKMEIVGQCASGAFHELRNILTIIEMYAHLALAERPEHPKLAKSLNEIQTAAGKAANLTRQLVNFSRKEDPKQFGPVEPMALFNELSDTLRQLLPRSIQIECNCSPDLPPIHGDAGALGQVIFNLALNARDAMPSGGTLYLQAERVDLDAAPSGHPEIPPGPYICLRVTDNGCGMDTVIRTRLFEPFFTTKEAGVGTGLGMSVSAEIVQQHHGWMDISSQPGHGSSFSVHLPVNNPFNLERTQDQAV